MKTSTKYGIAALSLAALSGVLTLVTWNLIIVAMKAVD